MYLHLPTMFLPIPGLLLTLESPDPGFAVRPADIVGVDLHVHMTDTIAEVRWP